MNATCPACRQLPVDTGDPLCSRCKRVLDAGAVDELLRLSRMRPRYRNDRITHRRRYTRALIALREGFLELEQAQE